MRLAGRRARKPSSFVISPLSRLIDSDGPLANCPNSDAPQLSPPCTGWQAHATAIATAETTDRVGDKTLQDTHGQLEDTLALWHRSDAPVRGVTRGLDCRALLVSQACLTGLTEASTCRA